jgi:hypothetical protein
MTKCPDKRGGPLQGDNLVVFYYLNTSRIYRDKRDGFWWEMPQNMGTTAQ